jgi:uncharacterized protein YcnI
MKRTTAAIALAAGALAVPAAAQAHVTVQPTSVPAGAQTVLSVRVPNERDDASTVKVDVKLPPGFAAASWASTPGWRCAPSSRGSPRRSGPTTGRSTSRSARSCGRPRAGKDGIAPGEFRDFPLSVVVPGKAGQTLTFKALQTYSNGDVVRWIGAPGADEPAPRVKLTAASTPAAGGANGGGRQQANPQPAPAAAVGDGDSNTLSIVALVVGALGLLAGGAALVVARRGVSRG